MLMLATESPPCPGCGEQAANQVAQRLKLVPDDNGQPFSRLIVVLSYRCFCGCEFQHESKDE